MTRDMTPGGYQQPGDDSTILFDFANYPIRRNKNGLRNAADLLFVANPKKPARAYDWARLQSTREFIADIAGDFSKQCVETSQSGISRFASEGKCETFIWDGKTSVPGVIEVNKGGTEQGIWLCDEACYEIAMWVSVQFKRAVIRYFRYGVEPGFAQAAEQTDFLKQPQADVIVTLDEGAVFKHGGMEFGPGVHGVRMGGKIIAFERVQKPQPKKAPKPLIEKRDQVEARRQEAATLVESIREAIQRGRIALEEAAWKNFGASIEVPKAKAWRVGQQIAWHVAPLGEHPPCVAIAPKACLAAIGMKTTDRLAHDLLAECGIILETGWRHAGSPQISVYRIFGRQKRNRRPRLWILRDDNGELTGKTPPPLPG